MDGESGEEKMNMNGHKPPRLDILGGESGMEKRGATKEGDKTSCIGGGAGRAKDKPVGRELLGAEIHIIDGAVDFLEVKGINTGMEFGEERKFAGVEMGNKRVKGTGIPGS